MSVGRVTALAASLVCSVASTRWPVSEAWMAICGLEVADLADHDDVRVLAQDGAQQGLGEGEVDLAVDLRLAHAGQLVSIGSSTVMMLLRVASRRERAAYSVVVLPEPVGR